MEVKKDEGRDTPEGRRGKFGSKEHERKMKNVMREQGMRRNVKEA